MRNKLRSCRSLLPIAGALLLAAPAVALDHRAGGRGERYEQGNLAHRLARARRDDRQKRRHEGPCADLAGAAFGLCNAFCGAKNCDELDPQPVSCQVLRRVFERKTGMTVFPCEEGSVTPTMTFTPTGTPAGSATATFTATAAPPTETATAEATETATLEATETATPEPTDTATLQPTDTATPEATDTAAPEPTDTATLQPTDTATPEATDTATPEPTDTPTEMPTGIPTGTAAALVP